MTDAEPEARRDAGADDVRALLARAMDLHETGRLAEAEQAYLAVADRGYRRVEIAGLLAGLAEASGRPEVALARWAEVLAERPTDVRALAATGALLHRRGQWEAAAEALTAAAAVAPDDEQVMADLGVVLFDAGRHDQALAAFRRAAARWPDRPALRHQLRRAAAAVVPSWHLPMLNDRARNDAFERAIVQAVRAHGPDAVVLDIGTGSGLLAMMAARAGAGAVVACEAVPALAETARAVIAANGYADRIRVVPRSSTTLAVGEDLPRPADLLISEILSSDVLAEYVLPTFEDALARLVAPGATIIPRAVTAVGCLAGGAALERLAHVDRVAGFDLSAFSGLAPPRVPLAGASTAWTRLSPVSDLLRLDLTARSNPPVLSSLDLPVEADGTAIGVVQWMRVELGDGVAFANPPQTAAEGHWLQTLHTFPRPLPVAAGGTVELAVGHDRTSLIVMPA